MQQQFAPAENTMPSAASYQATPQEFARAAAEVETQPLTKEALKHLPSSGEQRPRTTLTDGEGHVFTIEGTAQQLLTEMQAYRAVKHQDVAMTRRSRKELSWWLLLGGFLASSAAALGITFLFLSFAHKQNELFENYNKHQQVALVNPWTNNSNIASPMTPERVLLSQVADNTPVYASYSDLTALARGKLAAQQVSVLRTPGTNTAGTSQWTLLKSNGHYFVRGWRYVGDGSYKAYKGWFASIASDSSIQETSEIPIERFESVAEPPSIVQDADGTGEQVYLPDAP